MLGLQNSPNFYHNLSHGKLWVIGMWTYIDPPLTIQNKNDVIFYGTSVFPHYVKNNKRYTQANNYISVASWLINTTHIFKEQNVAILTNTCVNDKCMQDIHAMASSIGAVWTII